MEVYFSLENDLIKEAATDFQIQGPAVDALISAMSMMWGNTEVDQGSELNDSGFNRLDWSYVQNSAECSSIAHAVPGNPVSALAAKKCLTALFKYKGRQVRNYDQISQGINALINQQLGQANQTGEKVVQVKGIGKYNNLEVILSGMTIEDKKAINKLAKEFIESNRAPSGQYPAWATWNGKIATFKLFSIQDELAQICSIGQPVPEWVPKITEFMASRGFDVSQLTNYAQQQAAQQQQAPAGQPQQQQLTPNKLKARLDPQRAAVIQIEFPYSKEIVDAVKNIKGRQWNPTMRIWDLHRPDPKELDTFASFMQSKGFDVNEFLTVIEEYKKTAASDPANGKKPLNVVDVSDSTAYLVEIELPRSEEDRKELSEFVKFSFPPYGRKDDVMNRPEGAMRVMFKYKHYLFGTYDDLVRFGLLLDSRKWDTSSLKQCILSCVKSGKLQRTRYTGELDGYQTRDASGKLINDAEKFYQDLEGTLKPKDPTFKLYPKQKQGIAWLYSRNNAILGDKTGAGKCAKFDTTIFINGQLMTFEEVWNKYHNADILKINENEEWCEPSQKLLVNSFDGKEIITTEVGGLFRQRLKGKLRKIKTWTGRTITTTYAHKFLTPDGWTNDIKVGDCILSPRFIPIQSESFTDCNDDLAELLGWQISEGHESKNSIHITQQETKVLDRLKTIYDKLAFDNNLIKLKTKEFSRGIIRQYNDKPSYLCISSVAYREFLESKGYIFGLKSKDKQIPFYILHSKDSCVRKFLSAYFSAESYCDTKKRRIDICSASKKLIQQLSYMLGRFGIQHSFGETQKCATNGTRIKRPYYRLYIIGNGVKQFVEEIGFWYAHKNEAFVSQIQKSNPNKEGKPIGKIVGSFFSKYNIPPLHANIRDLDYVSGQKWMGNEGIDSVIRGFESIINGESLKQYSLLKKSKWTGKTIEAYHSLKQEDAQSVIDQLVELRNSDLQYERIVSVEDIEYDNYVYDFTIPNNENYIAENLICHNTTSMLSAAMMRMKQSGGRTLIITLPSTQQQWVDEIGSLFGEEEMRNVSTDAGSNAKWTILTYQDFASTQKKNEKKEPLFGPTGVPLVKRPKVQAVLDVIAASQFTVTLLDEGHMLKNESAAKSINIANVTKSIPFKWAGSATPVANKPDDIHNLLRIIGHNLGKINDAMFQREFVGQNMTIKDMRNPEEKRIALKKVQEEAALRLRKWLTLSGAYISRSKKAMNPNIPDHTVSEYDIDESQFDKQKYWQDFSNRLDKYKKPDLAISQMIGERITLAMSKVPATLAQAYAVLDMKDEQGQPLREKVLCFSCFKEPCEMLVNGLKQHLAKTDPSATVRHIMGNDKRASVIQAMADFRNDKNARGMVIASLKGGTGVNLPNTTRNVVMNDFDWTPKITEQTEGRAYRINNIIPVSTKYMIAKGTPDEVFYRYVRAKIDLSNIIQDMDSELEEKMLVGIDDKDLKVKLMEAKEKLDLAETSLVYDLKAMMEANGVAAPASMDPSQFDLDEAEMGDDNASDVVRPRHTASISGWFKNAKFAELEALVETLII